MWELSVDEVSSGKSVRSDTICFDINAHRHAQREGATYKNEHVEEGGDEDGLESVTHVLGITDEVAAVGIAILHTGTTRQR